MALVYSTDGGRMCPHCRQPLTACRCGEAARRAVRGDGQVRVSRERGGRGGKTVTLVRGLALDADALAALGKRLRSACGAGGAIKDGVLEIQGDHVERVLGLLVQEGIAAKRAGG
jgi:translation initiation factor 1